MINDFQNYWDQKWSRVTKVIGPSSFAIDVSKYLKSDKKILDIGCGTGRDSEYFNTLGLQVDALDFSNNAFKDIKCESIRKLHTSIQDYNFGINQYDYIYANNSLHYFSLNDFHHIIDKIYKSMKPQGLLFIRVKSVSDRDYKKGRQLEKNYFKNGQDLKYFFTKDIVLSALGEYDIISLKTAQDIHKQISGKITNNSFIDIVAQK